MALAEAKNEFTLSLNRSLNAPREQVFRAWTDTEALSRWFAPNDEFETRVTELDVREGGRYRIEMHAPDGEVHVVGGEYVSVAPPEKLVFTWAWEHSEDPTEMLVTVELVDNGDTTELILTHDRLPDEHLRELHNEGWVGCLGRLVKMFNG